MPDSDQIRKELAVFLQEKTASRLKNTLFPVMPTLEFIWALNGDKNGPDGLGRPKSGLAVGRLAGVGKANLERLYAERTYLPIIQTFKPAKSEIKAMTDYDSKPVVPMWETDNATLNWFKQPRFRFARKSMPYKVAHSAVRTAKRNARGGAPAQAAEAIRSVYDVEIKTRMAVLIEKLNDELWGINGEPGYPANEDSVTWTAIHSLKNALRNDNVYGGIDRSISTNSWWRGNYITAATSLSFEDVINYCNYDLEMIKYGLGVQIIGVGGALMKKAKAEAKAESYNLITNGISEYPEFGFKREIVRIYSGNRPVYVYFDPAIPAGHAACLDPSTWTVAIHPDYNFKISTPSDQTKVEGGDEADTGTIDVELLMCCEVPKGNAYFTNLS